MESSSYTKDKYITLNNGSKIPRIGYGTWEGTNLTTLIKAAVTTGYRHIDTARAYENEKDIGVALKEIFSEGNVKREDLFITTKVFNDAKDNVEASLTASLADLQLDSVDLLLIHWPIGTYDFDLGQIKQVPLHKTWKEMEGLVKKGLCKAIGVCNFNVQLLLDLLSYAEIKPVCNQVELHPYLTQEDLVKFCFKYDIMVTAYSPLCRGTNNFEKDIQKEPLLIELAQKYGKTVAQVVLNWHLSRGYVIIPKTSTPSRLQENFESDSFEMSKEDLERVGKLDCGYRVLDPRLYEDPFYLTPLFS